MAYLSVSQGIGLALVVYFVIGYANQFAAENQVWHEMQRPPLYDRGHQLIPQMKERWANLGLVGLMAYFVVRWGLRQPKLLEEFLWMAALLFVGRVVAFTVTQVPPARTGCSTRSPGDPWRFVPFAGRWKECNDQMYSGHTLHCVLIALFVLYLPCSLWEKAAVLLCVAAELVLLIGGRLHYTADVVVGVIVAVLVFFAWPGIDNAVTNLKTGGPFGQSLSALGPKTIKRNR